MSLLANAIWYLSSLPAGVRFARATKCVADVQRKKLLSLLRANSETAFGRSYDFDSINSVEEYQARVPLTDYEELRPWLTRSEQGENAVLTSERVLLMEPTSGSSAATKLIPYTRSLKREFQAGLSPWVMYTFGRYPGLLQGQSYWSVTPVMDCERYTDGGLPIGFEEDSEYLSGPAARAVRSLMAVPPEVKHIADLESFRYVTLLFLLRSRSLSLISVWNPTFLLLLLEALPAWWSQLVDNIGGGEISPPQSLDPKVHAALTNANRADAHRAVEIALIMQNLPLQRTERDLGEVHRLIWPRLRLISCWADSAAAPYATRLAGIFPGVAVQPKGLLSTEAFVSFPVPGKEGGALSLRSHFFEFLTHISDTESPQPYESNQERAYLAHELEIGRRYSVVVTTGGGLYRYRMHDQVEVTGHIHDCPLVRFVGRDNVVSDWFGEKLNEEHVSRALSAACAEHAIHADFALLACDNEPVQPVYTLYFQDSQAGDDELIALGRSLEHGLRQNYHYDYCRRVGQLGALCVFRVERNAAADYVRGAAARGQRVGDIKPVLLSRDCGWSANFSGRLIVRQEAV